jgi:hypothetical protein
MVTPATRHDTDITTSFFDMESKRQQLDVATGTWLHDANNSQSFNTLNNSCTSFDSILTKFAHFCTNLSLNHVHYLFVRYSYSTSQKCGILLQTDKCGIAKTCAVAGRISVPPKQTRTLQSKNTFSNSIYPPAEYWHNCDVIITFTITTFQIVQKKTDALIKLNSESIPGQLLWAHFSHTYFHINNTASKVCSVNRHVSYLAWCDLGIKILTLCLCKSQAVGLWLCDI